MKLAFGTSVLRTHGSGGLASPSPVISPRLAHIHPAYDLARPGACATAHRPAATEAPPDPEGTALPRDRVCVLHTAAHGVAFQKRHQCIMSVQRDHLSERQFWKASINLKSKMS